VAGPRIEYGGNGNKDAGNTHGDYVDLRRKWQFSHQINLNKSLEAPMDQSSRFMTVMSRTNEPDISARLSDRSTVEFQTRKEYRLPLSGVQGGIRRSYFVLFMFRRLLTGIFIRLVVLLSVAIHL
jgi:hypothetical protein